MPTYDSLVSVSPTGTGTGFYPDTPTSGTATTSDKPPPPPKAAKAPTSSPTPEKPTPAPTADKTQTAMQGLGQLQQEYAERMPERPKPPQIPERPKTIKDDIQLWGALAIAFSALASRRTRMPMTTALNAAAAAMNGMREGDKERADQAYKEWQENTKIAFQMADYEQRIYEDILHDREHVDDIKLRATMESLGDEESKGIYFDALYKTGDQKQAHEALAAFHEHRQKTKEAAGKAQESILQYQIGHELATATAQSEEYKQAEAEAAAGHPEHKIKMLQNLEQQIKGAGGRSGGYIMSDDEAKEQADEALDGQHAPPNVAGTAGRSTNPNNLLVWKYIKEGAEERGWHYSESDYAAFKSLQQRLYGAAGDQIRAFTVLTHHTEFLDELAKELATRSGSQTVDGITQKVAREFGMPDITNFDLVKNFVADETVKAILGASVGGVTDRASAEKYVMPYMSPDQLAGATSSIRRLAGGQLGGRLVEYKKFIDRGWLKPEDVVPEDTLNALGFTHTDPKSLFDSIAKSGKPSAAEGTGGSSSLHDFSKLGNEEADKAYESLQSGDAFIGPDGKKYRKP